MTLRHQLALVLLVLGGIPSHSVTFGQNSIPKKLTGQVVDAGKPVAGAKIRVQGKSQFSLSDNQGQFQFTPNGNHFPRLTAWKKGYGIGSAPSKLSPLKILLSPLPTMDNEDYQWLDPRPSPQKPNNCGNCHQEIYQEWHSSAHGQSVHNKRFLNLFAGTDWHGKPSPKWNVLGEHPLGSAVCASCHAPTFNDPNLDYDMRKVPGVAAHGIHCDYCHKIVDAPTDNLGTRFGRDGLILLRPKNNELLFFGPLDDAFREGETFGHLPLYKESRYCASCHEGVVFGVHVYGTYSEWLKSPAKQKGQQCQDCHMKPTGKMTNFAPGKGGIERDPLTLASHRFPGATQEMLRQCLKVDVTLKPEGKTIAVQVKMTAHQVGHRVPTGFIDRNLLLIVEAIDEAGKPIQLKEGSMLPAAAGKKFMGKPGYLFAKLLHNPQGQAPSPFWLPHGKIVDTRLHPEQSDFKSFRFGPTLQEVSVRVLYRRFWQNVADSKNWPDDQIVVFEQTQKLKTHPR